MVLLAEGSTWLQVNYMLCTCMAVYISTLFTHTLSLSPTEPFTLNIPPASVDHRLAVATLTQAQADMQLDPSLAAMVNAQSQAINHVQE